MKPLYRKTGKYHAWDHIELVRKSALDIIRHEKYKINPLLVEAAVYIHDIGRTVQDKNHPEISAKLATPFLKKINVPDEEAHVILTAVSHHDKYKIRKTKFIEAKVLFDADKLQIITIFGFLRCWKWLVEERKMKRKAAGRLLLKYIEDIDLYFYSSYAKKKMKDYNPHVKFLVEDILHWQKMEENLLKDIKV